ncbi:hypothetical protein B1P99_004285 [Salmonella enterica subsp. enterica serovar Gaminara]|nr:hypothetical protein [Salmonella enterica subsp. enterica serovar Gaminara]
MNKKLIFILSLLSTTVSTPAPASDYFACYATNVVPGRITYTISGTYKQPIVQRNINYEPTITYDPIRQYGNTTVLERYWFLLTTQTNGYENNTGRAYVDLGAGYRFEFTPTPQLPPQESNPKLFTQTSGTTPTCNQLVDPDIILHTPKSGSITRQDGHPPTGVHTIRRQEIARQAIGVSNGSGYKPFSSYEIVVEGQILGLAECSLNLKDIYLNHGTLKTTEANENATTTTGNITCNAETNVKIQIADSTPNTKSVSVPMGDDVYTDLDFKINEKWTANDVFHLSSGVTPITLRSKIKYKHGSGVYRGSTVLIINVQ